MNIYKFTGRFRQVFFGTMAVLTSMGGVVATNMSNAYAADRALDNNTQTSRRLTSRAAAKKTTIAMSTSKKVIFINNKYTRKATLTTSNKKDVVQYKSSNKSIATVSSSGVVTGKKKGTVTITASSKLEPKVKSSYKVKVIKKYKKNEKLFIAHRGYSSIAPENSIPAFEAAGKKGFGAIECDIYETAKDKKGNSRFIIMHDSTLNRMCKLSGNKVYQSKLTYDTIRKNYYIKSGVNVSKYSKDQLRIPSLEEYLSICKKYKVKPVIEIKQEMGQSSIKRVYQCIKNAGLQNNAIVISRSKNSLLYMQKCNKKVQLQLVTDKVDNNIIGWVTDHHIGLCMNKNIASGTVVSMLKSRKISLNLWTLSTKEELSDYGYDGVNAITSNYALWS